jgi:hypothetical protein
VLKTVLSVTSLGILDSDRLPSYWTYGVGQRQLSMWDI